MSVSRGKIRAGGVIIGLGEATGMNGQGLAFLGEVAALLRHCYSLDTELDKTTYQVHGPFTQNDSRELSSGKGVVLRVTGGSGTLLVAGQAHPLIFSDWAFAPAGLKFVLRGQHNLRVAAVELRR